MTTDITRARAVETRELPPCDACEETGEVRIGDLKMPCPACPRGDWKAKR